MRYLTIIFCAVLVLLSFHQPQAEIIHVPDDSSTIQGAINGAVNGDTVLVASGTYYEHIDFNGKAILVTSEAGPDSTTIAKASDGISIVTFISGEDTTSILDGFTITGAQSAPWGGGIRCEYSSPRIRNNVIDGNSATNKGGGFSCWWGHPVLEANTIMNNTAYDGGGGIFFYDCDASIRNNLIKVNSCDEHGGGIFVQESNGTTIESNLILSNSSSDLGGGVLISGASNIVVVNNTILNNASASGEGGGVCIWYSDFATLVSNIIVGSSTGHGIYSSNSTNSVIEYNDVWNNLPADYSGISPGEGCISADPVFCDPENEDYYLSFLSPCVGTGQNGADIGALGMGCGLVIVTPGPDEAGPANTQVSVVFYIQANQGFADTFDLNVTDQLGWNIEPTHYEVVLDSGQVDTVDFTVSIPSTQIGTIDSLRLDAASRTDSLAWDWACLAVTCDAYNLQVTDISDVGNDQGKQVSIEWLSFPGSDPLVTDFSVFRRKDSLLTFSPAISVHSPGSLPIYPPGEWEWLVTLPAFGETLYSVVVPTLKDLTIAEGMYWSVFFVRAGTDNPTIYFDSPIDSGYSLDNLSPSPPAGLFALREPGAMKLTWSPTIALDFDFYTLYRDTLSGFTPAPNNRLGFTIDSVYFDSSAELGRTYYYLVSATDFSGNESEPSNEAMGPGYLTGDANGDGEIDVADITYLINYLFLATSAPNPLWVGDCNCDGVVDIGDIVYLINYLFLGGAPPGC